MGKLAISEKQQPLCLPMACQLRVTTHNCSSTSKAKQHWRMCQNRETPK